MIVTIFCPACRYRIRRDVGATVRGEIIADMHTQPCPHACRIAGGDRLVHLEVVDGDL